MLYSYHYLLSPRQAHQLLWSRFVNTKGQPSHNIACDLHMEHLNRSCKDALYGLGANKTPKAITHFGKAIGTMKSIVDNYDETTTVTAPSGQHSVPSFQKDQDMIVQDLPSAKIFDEIPGRSHPCFPNLHSSIISQANYEQLKQWISEHIP